MLLLALLLLAAQEAALRALFPMPEWRGFDRIDYTAVSASEALSGMPGLARRAFTWTSEPDGAASLHELNLYGFRDGEWPAAKPAGRPRLLFAGDSMVEGVMVAAGEALPARFAAAAAARGVAVEALNMGVATAGAPALFRLIRDAVPRFAPDWVVLVLYANDFPLPPFDAAWLAGGAPLARNPPLAPRLVHVLARLRAGRGLPRRWRGAPAPFFAAVPHPTNPWSDPAFAAAHAHAVDDDVEQAMRAGRFNPYVVDEHAIFLRKLSTPGEAAPHVQALAGFLERRGTRLLLCYLPSRSQVSDAYLEAQARYNVSRYTPSLVGESYQIHAPLLAGACAAAGVAFVDLTPALRRAEAAGERLYFDYDEHLRPRGHERAAAALVERWLAARADGK